jgi:hypothetical protein
MSSQSSTRAGSLLRSSSLIVSSLGTAAPVSAAGGTVPSDVTIVEGPTL